MKHSEKYLTSSTNVTITQIILKIQYFISPQFPNKLRSLTGNKCSVTFCLLNDAIPEVYQTRILHNGE